MRCTEPVRSSRSFRQNRATSAQRNRWINERRWTVSHKATSIRAANMGLDYARYPEETIREELDNGQLKLLPLAEGGERAGTLYLRRAPECDALPSSFARAWQRARSRAPWRAARSRADSCGNADLRHGLDTEDVTH